MNQRFSFASNLNKRLPQQLAALIIKLRRSIFRSPDDVVKEPPIRQRFAPISPSKRHHPTQCPSGYFRL
jgi:hypothetical protein